jgi:hypothetical protein
MSSSPSPEATPPPADRSVPPPESETPAWWHRWGVSLAVALLLHAVIATVLVLAWRKFAPLNPPGAVIVELPPPEARTNAEPAEPTFATISAGAGRSEAAEHAAIDHPIAELSTRGKAAAEESEPTFAGRQREGGLPAENAAEKPEEVRTATGGGEPRPPPGPQVGGAPIDTRIAPSFGPPGKKPPRKLARSLSPLGGPAKQAGAPAASRRLSALPSSVVINAIGARVEDRARAAMARANASGNGSRNAVGNTITTNAGNAAAGSAESVVINAVGMVVHVHPAVSPPANSAVGAGATASPGRMPAAGVNGGTVNGTGMGHVATRGGAIGGPTRNVPGALNGTDFHPRHP